jgi:putative ABC transport system permease protein
MPLLPRVRSLWNTLAHKDRLDRELDEELRAAVETMAERYRSEGMNPAAARRAAARELGGVEGLRDEVREARIGAGIDALVLDLRYAWRALRKAPGFTAVIIITLALGIGANTAIFSVVHAMLLKPLPYRDADRLAFIWLDRTATNVTLSSLGYPRGPMSGPDLRNLRDGTRTFSDFGGIWASGTIALTEGGEPEQLRGALVTTNFFQVLGVETALGRTFRPEDTGAETQAIVIGWDLFQRRFGGDPSVVGRRIKVNDNFATVVGVLPRDFRLLLPTDAATPDHLQAFAPFWPDLEGGPRGNLFLRVVGRLRPGVTIEQGRDDVAAVSRALSKELGSQRTFTTVALQDDSVREIRGPLLALFGGVAILLTIACVNVAGLLIARAASRSKEIALRIALGASRGRLLRQALVEGSLLTLLGATAGIFVGYAGLRALLALTPESLSRLDASRIDPTVLAFTLGTAVVWGLLLSLAPLAELFKANAGRSLQRHSRTTAAPVRYRARAALVVGQIALSVILLVSAALLVRAFVEVLRVDPGFHSDRQLTFRTLVPRETFVREVLEKVSGLPGVTGAGAFSHLPYDDLPNWALPYSVSSPVPADAPMIDARAISPGLLEALGVQLVDGRLFTDHDKDPDSPVVIVDDKLARLLGLERGAVGRTLFVNSAGGRRLDGASRRLTIVGVVRHLHLRSIVDDQLPQLFVPWQLAQRNPMAFVVRTSGDPLAIAPAIRATVASLDKRLAIYDVRPMTDYVESARATRRFTVMLAAAFAATALVLTCVGVYGVLAYAVALRRHEFGVRRALGADTRQVLREVIREGAGFAIAGCAGGLAGAFAAGQLLQSQLYGVHPRDPVSYGVAVTLILVGAVAACGIPAWRASTVSPMDALRSE